MTNYLRYGAAVFALLLFALNAQAMTDGEASELGMSLGDSGTIYGEGSISGLNAEQELGVSAEGDMDGEGRNVATNYRQVLSNQVECPVEVGEGGKRVMIQQFATQCETAAGNSRRIWVCIPNDINDIADRDCANGNWFSAATSTTDDTWKEVVKGLKIRLKDCQSNTCTLDLEKDGSFEGGQAAAQSEGEQTLANSEGAAEAVKNQGAALPDGTVLQPGKNENSGEYVGEMMAAGDVGECVGDVKASLDGGTPVFSCDGQKEAGTLTTGEECEDVKECVEWEETEITATKTCEVSLSYSSATCDVQSEVYSCDIKNVINTYECQRSRYVEYVASKYPAKYNVVTVFPGRTITKPRHFSDNLKYFSSLTYKWANLYTPNKTAFNTYGAKSAYVPDGSTIGMTKRRKVPRDWSYELRSNIKIDNTVVASLYVNHQTMLWDQSRIHFYDPSLTAIRPLTGAEYKELFRPRWPSSVDHFWTGGSIAYAPSIGDWSIAANYAFNKWGIGAINTGSENSSGLEYDDIVDNTPQGDVIRPEYYAQGYRLNGEHVVKLYEAESCNPA